jgi:hypothetical protein
VSGYLALLYVSATGGDFLATMLSAPEPKAASQGEHRVHTALSGRTLLVST